MNHRLDILYYPFGRIQPGRSQTLEDYSFGFNGKEKDDEINGTGATYDYGFKIYDARIGKFLSVDPLTKDFPWYTPYQFAGNTPIVAIDLDGLEEVWVTYYQKNDGTLEVLSIEEVAEEDRAAKYASMGLNGEATKEGYISILANVKSWNMFNEPVLEYRIIQKTTETIPSVVGEKSKSTTEKVGELEASMVGNSYYDNAKYESKEGLNKYGWKAMGTAATFVTTAGLSTAGEAGLAAWMIASSSMAKNINDLSEKPLVNTSEGKGRVSSIVIDGTSVLTDLYPLWQIPMKIPVIITDTKSLIDNKFSGDKKVEKK